MAKSPYVILDDFTGGINDMDSPFSIAPNEVVEAKNVDFRSGKIATKRGGMASISLASSALAYARPRIATIDTGTGLAVSSKNVTISPYTNVTDGTGATYHKLIIWVATNNIIRTVTAMTLGGVTCTNINNISNGASGRIEVWSFDAPPEAGATLAVTLAGACEVAIVAQRWTECAASVAGSSSLTGASNTVSETLSGIDERTMVLVGMTNDPLSVFANTTGGMQVTLVPAGANTTNAKLVNLAMQGYSNLTYQFTGGAAVNWAAIRVFMEGRDDNALGFLGLTHEINGMFRFSPTNNPTDDELWIIDNWGRIARLIPSGGWSSPGYVNTKVGMVGDMLNSANSIDYNVNGVSLHGKLFLALFGGSGLIDRMVVWDPVTGMLRWAGLVQPAVPVAANTGGGAYAAVLRYYRVRWTEQGTLLTGGTGTLRRSEPSTAVSFTPSGAGTGVLVTMPALGSARDGTFEGQTHWELEASTDGNLFYRIATTVVGTTTVTDSAATTTYSSNPLSENIGLYALPTAPRHLAVDQDRLMIGGNLFFPVLDARVSWTPPRGDSGVGNDERVPIPAPPGRYYQDLDGMSGGGITHMIPGMMGGVYVFKLGKIYKMIRTGSADRAYDIQYESNSRGCFQRAGNLATDKDGRPSVFFVDPAVGACAFTDEGVVDLMKKRNLSDQINKLQNKFTVNARVIFHPKRWQVWFFFPINKGALNGQLPNYACCWDIVNNCWTDWTGVIVNTTNAILYTTQFGGDYFEAPILANYGMQTSLLGEGDQGVVDDTSSYRGFIVSRPYQIGELYKKFGIMAGVLHAVAAAATTIGVALIRNFGIERKDVSVSIAPVGAETYVVKPLDNAKMSECQFVQVELGDPVSFNGSQLNQTWTLDEYALKPRSEDESTS